MLEESQLAGASASLGMALVGMLVAVALPMLWG
jgi:putative effector of murein hydrolase